MASKAVRLKYMEYGFVFDYETKPHVKVLIRNGKKVKV